MHDIEVELTMKRIFSPLSALSLLLCALNASAADSDRDRYGSSSGLAGVARCQCSEGTNLAATGGVVFSCKCGSLDCVIVGTAADPDKADNDHTVVCSR